jgi:2-polyprenyl-3-methyl-5-hydroxy-6-metoxy-1,4-benzoquinol methylase
MSSDPSSGPISKRRLHAATSSAGTSDTPIYDAVLRLVDTETGSGHVLDFGAGSGYLCRRLCERSRFDRVTAADLVLYDNRYVHPAVTWVAADLNEPLPLNDGVVDLLLGVEVIEHLENPWAVAREWFRLLKPGGLVIGSTPNNESWRALVSLVARGHFVAFGDENYPAHITPLLRCDLRRLLVEAGFELPSFHFTDDGRVPRLRCTWQQVSKGRLRGLRYSDNVVWWTRKPHRPPS